MHFLLPCKRIRRRFYSKEESCSSEIVIVSLQNRVFTRIRNWTYFMEVDLLAKVNKSDRRFVSRWCIRHFYRVAWRNKTQMPNSRKLLSSIVLFPLSSLCSPILFLLFRLSSLLRRTWSPPASLVIRPNQFLSKYLAISKLLFHFSPFYKNTKLKHFQHY